MSDILRKEVVEYLSHFAQTLVEGPPLSLMFDRPITIKDLCDSHEQLRKERDEAKDDAESLMEDIQALGPELVAMQKERDRYREALKEIANQDPLNREAGPGEIARQALNPPEPKETENG